MGETRWLTEEDLRRYEAQERATPVASNGQPAKSGTAQAQTGAPDAFWDWIAPALGNAELRVLLYLIRRTLGFHKMADAVSTEQFVSGIVHTDGTRMDCGTGLAARHVRQAIADLASRELIFVEGDSVGGRARTKRYRLNYEAICRKETPKGVRTVPVSGE